MTDANDDGWENSSIWKIYLYPALTSPDGWLTAGGEDDRRVYQSACALDTDPFWLTPADADAYAHAYVYAKAKTKDKVDAYAHGYAKANTEATAYADAYAHAYANAQVAAGSSSSALLAEPEAEAYARSYSRLHTGWWNLKQRVTPLYRTELLGTYPTLDSGKVAYRLHLSLYQQQ